MSFTKLSTDVDVHQKLGDYPNSDDGMTAQQLKQEFDKPADILKEALNRLVDELNAESASRSLGADAIHETDETDGNVQAKLEYLYNALQDVVAGQIPDGSITAVKLATDSVTTAKIEDEAITLDKLGSSVLDFINSKIEQGTYTGDGTYGSGNPTTITFSKAPKVVLITESGSMNTTRTLRNVILTPNISGKTATGYYTPSIYSSGDLNISWSNDNKTLEIYSTKNALWQFNYNGDTYEYIALC